MSQQLWSLFATKVENLELCVWSASGDLYEHFEALKEPEYEYSFTYALFVFNEDKNDYVLLRNGFIDKRKTMEKTKTNVMAKISVKDFQRIMSPMRIIITDMTNYISAQPLLSLDLVLNEDVSGGKPVRISAPFNVDYTEVPKNRQIDMPLPGVATLSIEFNLKEMVHKSQVIPQESQ
jgi:hypothetical protein